MPAVGIVADRRGIGSERGTDLSQATGEQFLLVEGRDDDGELHQSIDSAGSTHDMTGAVCGYNIFEATDVLPPIRCIP
jgi:hypothetical protein